MKVKVKDTVKVIAGAYKGKEGRVLKIFRATNRVIVEGVNIKKRHTRPNQTNPQGGIIEKEAPIQVSNVMVLDPKSKQPTRIGMQVILDEKTGKKRRVRVSRASGEMLQ